MCVFRDRDARSGDSLLWRCMSARAGRLQAARSAPCDGCACSRGIEEVDSGWWIGSGKACRWQPTPSMCSLAVRCWHPVRIDWPAP
jgi:hypothetical protein